MRELLATCYDMTTSSIDPESPKELHTDLGVLRYYEAGDGPPLVLLHGSGPGVTGWRNFRGNMDVFAEHFRTFVLEFPGFGVSDDFGGHPMATATDAVERFLDGLGLDTVALLGNSMGGIVATRFAIEFPERVSKLVTIGGIGKNLLSPGPGEGIQLLMDFTDDPTRERLISWLHSMVFDPAMVTEELIEERWVQATDPQTLASARKMYSRAAFAANSAAALESSQTPYWAQLHRVQAPTLLTWGRDDRVSPMDMALMPMRLIPNAELHVFPQCGHWVMIEQKAAFESAVVAFLLRKDVADT